VSLLSWSVLLTAEEVVRRIFVVDDSLWKDCWRHSTLDDLALAEVVQSESIRDVDKTLEHHRYHWTFKELSTRRKLQALTFHFQA
jgi:hypothetical protein